MQVATRFSQPLEPYTFKRPQGDPPNDPGDKFETRHIVGGVLGGSALGLGLGYAGLELGMRAGMNAAIGSLGPSPAAELVSIFVPGIHYMILGGALGMAVGATAGGATGAYLGVKIADLTSKSS